jgi:syringomycin synthetase protein SyrE
MEERPNTQVEEDLARIWREVLDVDGVGRCDDFFALGGHSLTAMRVMTRVRRQFGVDLGVSALFEHPELADLALAVTEAQRVNNSTGGAELEDGR